MELLIPSFLAGVLTILAPCVFAILPVILTGSISDAKDKWRPYIIIGALTISVIVFTLLLKATTVFIEIPNSFWRYFSGVLIIVLSLTMVFPEKWSMLTVKLKLYKSEELIEKNKNKAGIGGAALLGASLGPVFTSCSPTYLFIVATVLPQSFGIGLVNLIIYAIGLALPLLAIAVGGQKVVKKLRFAANPNGKFKKVIGLLLLLIGIAIFTGFDKTVENKLIEAGFTGASEFETQLIQESQNQ